ncbi:MAG: PilZ domain-containing protein [Deltaproteobacteria bacterium]|nr:PilZ domain-containing protein [Deltaproteobacteria bacterium]MBW2017566.1 PilZ domain-containing protein [Deltaproteobacteria bacterium]MBW2130254.1 PilZ domain-containing protein [Deltaproteobacteria bacterium]MBW2302540.1 PilZ domain-containing protein [Deltaproteobacteria bacterium]
MKEEKRRFTRIPFRVKAELAADGKVYGTDTIKNLSVGGCLLPLKEKLEPGTRCRVKIFLTGTNQETAVRVEGRILRSDSTGTAVRFTHIDPDSLFHLKGIVRFNAPDPEAVEEEINRHPVPL